MPPAEPMLGIKTTALEKARRREAVVDEFRPYVPPTGVIPAGKRETALAMDATPYDYINQAYVNNFFPGYQYLAMLAQLPEYRKFSEIPAKDMTRKWIEIRSKGDGEDKEDRIAALGDALDKYNIRDLFQKAAEKDALYGRAQLYVDVAMPNGGDPRDNPQELQSPLFIHERKIKKGSLKGFNLIEPVWTYPGIYNATDPLRADFYRPSEWYVMGKTVHHTRLLTFISRPVPDLLKASYNFGGLSMSQMAQPYVQNWIRTRDSVSDMLHSFSVSGLKTNLSSVLAGTDDAQFAKRAELFNTMRDNRGLMLLDMDTEDFFQFNTPIGGLDSLQAQAQEQMSAVSNIPVVKLLGITPSGLNASADGEIQVYYDYLHSQQEALFRENLAKVIDIIQLSEFGEIDPDITFDFETLYGMDDTEKATVRKTNADSDAQYVMMGAISPEEVRAKIAADPESGYDALADEIEEDELDEGVDPDAAADKAPFREEDHPRRTDGKFGEGGSTTQSSPETKKKETESAGSKSAHLVDAGSDREKWPEHIKALKLPPKWTDVRISPDADADLQAIGKDAKGRSQYVYSQKFKDSMAAAKFGRIRAMMQEFPRMKSQVEKDRASDDEHKTAADCMALVMQTGIRPGSENDTGAEKKAYGATTLEGRHVKIEDGNVTLSFVGKKGVDLEIPIKDQSLADMLIERKKAAGDSGQLFDGLNEQSLRDYAHTLDGGHFKTKDFRTHLGTTTALKLVEQGEPPTSEKEYKKRVKDIATKVSKMLGNTPAVALQSYIDPTVFSGWRAAYENA